jgi:hypothetical protein
MVRPPKIFPALTGGFNLVASNIYLILIPVALDLLLWFGLHLRLQALLQPALATMLDFFRRTASPEMTGMVDNMGTLWTLFLERFNLFSQLSTFPLGVPSLIASLAPLNNPLGAAPAMQFESIFQAALGWLGLTLLGYVLGALYFSVIAQSFAQQSAQVPCEGSLPGQPGGKIPPLSLGVLAWQTLQLVALVIILLIVLLILLVPAVLISSFLALLNPIIAQFALLLMSFSLVWFLIPLIFSPHGIFLCGQSVINAMLNSTRVVRFSLSGTGLFLLVAVVLYQGMGVLWRVPPEESWMTLIGIAGNAFISTGLLAASFIYYRSGLDYIQALRKLSAKSA